MKIIKSFLRLVEIQTKVASLFPLLIGTLLALYSVQYINMINFMLMLISLLCIDMATTGFNHYFDYKRAILKTGYHYEKHNPISSGELPQKKALPLLVGLVIIGVITGLGLVVRTDWVVFSLGSIAFAVGLGYSVGPLPISRTMLGELFSGLFMGGLIPLISYYIHLPEHMLGKLSYSAGTLAIELEISAWLPIVFTALPLVLLIANIMLANNICDREEDIVNKRYTLPVMIGIPNSLKLYMVIIIVAILSVVISVALGILPWHYAVILIAGPKMIRRMKLFVENPKKSETFVYAVQNFIVFSSLSVLGLSIATLLKILG